MKTQTTRRNFLGTGLGAALAVLASKGFNVTDVRAGDGDLITITGLTSAAGLRPHVHGFEAKLDLKTGEFSGATTSTISVGKEESTPHGHEIDDKVDPFDFDAAVETSEENGHIHCARPN